jgi:hypothetical protein
VAEACWSDTAVPSQTNTTASTVRSITAPAGLSVAAPGQVEPPGQIRARAGSGQIDDCVGDRARPRVRG